MPDRKASRIIDTMRGLRSQRAELERQEADVLAEATSLIESFMKTHTGPNVNPQVIGTILFGQEYWRMFTDLVAHTRAADFGCVLK